MRTSMRGLAVALMILAALPAFALELETTTPADRATGVPADTRIDLQFTNNVVDDDLQSGNASRIALLDSRGNLVPVTVEMADRRTNPERRKNIVVVPVETLRAGETYVVVVLPGLAARNGRTVEAALTVTFTTAE